MWPRNEAYSVYPNMNKWQICILHIVNICFVIFGIILVCLAGDLRADTNGIEYFIMQNYYVFSAMMTIAGIFNIIMGLIGVYCTLRHRFAVIFSYSYFIVLMLTALLLLAAVILGEELNSSAYRDISPVIANSMYNYNLEHLDVVFAWDILQMKFQCCGDSTPSDWLSIITNLPITCCQVPSASIGSFFCANDESNKNLYREGCGTLLLEFVRASLTYLAAIGIGFFVCQVIFLLIIFIFGWSLRETKNNDTRFIANQHDLNKSRDPIECLKVSEDNKSQRVYF